MKNNLRWAALGAALFASFWLGLYKQAAAQETRKVNILYIHADDHRADGLNALGNKLLQTPHLDSIAKSGMTFTRAYTMGSMIGAVCLPSRTMLLTGKSWLRIPAARGGDPAATLPKVLSAAGYETFHVGKGGNEYTAGIQAFDQNIVMEDRGQQRVGSSERHADAVLKFLSERKSTRPFYIYLAPPVPHDPRLAAPEFMGRYAAKDIPLPASFLPLHPFDNGEMTVRDEALAPWPRTPEDTKQQLADYYACITGFDYHVGRIFAQLKASGQWENTVIV
ncbi:sulfatase-like hydrolase/transferase, partial [Armatimonas sp.]|uniref:sulfatase-like hydrolase/transferase n=1 Tax=Armatimonas sp. TaxID=1872638 RepID=UPI00286D1DF9